MSSILSNTSKKIKKKYSDLPGRTIIKTFTTEIVELLNKHKGKKDEKITKMMLFNQEEDRHIDKEDFKTAMSENFIIKWYYEDKRNEIR